MAEEKQFFDLELDVEIPKLDWKRWRLLRSKYRYEDILESFVVSQAKTARVKLVEDADFETALSVLIGLTNSKGGKESKYTWAVLVHLRVDEGGQKTIYLERFPDK
jgi:hypothetical protein